MEAVRNSKKIEVEMNDGKLFRFEYLKDGSYQIQIIEDGKSLYTVWSIDDFDCLNESARVLEEGI